MTPYLTNFAVVQQDGAVPNDVADGIDAEIEYFVDGFDVLPDPHGRFVEVDARMASVRLEDDLVLFGHGILLVLSFVGLTYGPGRRRYLIRLRLHSGGIIQDALWNSCRVRPRKSSETHAAASTGARALRRFAP